MICCGCSAWGEGLFLALQTSAIAAMVLLYGNQPRQGKKKTGQHGSATLAIVFLIVYSALFYALTSGVTPMDVLWSMQAANVPIILVGKVYKQQDTIFYNHPYMSAAMSAYYRNHSSP